MASTLVTGWSTSTILSSATSYAAYSTEAYEEPCQAVQLSTRDGAVCSCGKCKIGVDVLNIKDLPMGEIRQVITAAYKLAHGSDVKDISWKLVPT